MSSHPVLTAADADDLDILSARLQDAVFMVGDMAYLKKERQFAFVANRFMWEDAKGRSAKRVRCGLQFRGITSVQVQNIRQDRKDAVLSLLAIRAEVPEGGSADDPARDVTLIFSGGGAIRLQVECIDVELRDIGEPWTTKNRPDHSEGA